MVKKIPFSESDRTFMSQAIEIAWSAKGKTFPNPAVGAVVVSKDKAVGIGATRQSGGPHAERVALAQAGGRARNAALFVTLEPCCHHGKTPPCTDAIIAAGIRRVVAAVADPNPIVNHKGLARLRSAGIQVEVGLLREAAARINEDFFWSITKHQAWITLKLACTLDGRIADETGESKWITGTEARRFAHELRRRHAAIAVGAGTLERDDPRLTVRHRKGWNPAHCIFTSRKKIHAASNFAKLANSTRSIVVVAGGIPKKIDSDPDSHIEFWHTGEGSIHDRLSVFAQMAFENDIPSILIEGGQKLASSFLEHGLVNRIYLLYGNKLTGGGLDGIKFSMGLPINNCICLKKREHLLLGDSFAITGLPDCR